MIEPPFLAMTLLKLDFSIETSTGTTPSFSIFKNVPRSELKFSAVMFLRKMLEFFKTANAPFFLRFNP